MDFRLWTFDYFMWFTIALAGYLLLAIVIILDKLILTKSVGKPAVYAFYSCVIMFGALVAWPFGVEFLRSGSDWLIALVSGLSFGLALWTFFIATKKGEASHISPFNGAVIAVAIFISSYYFLGEKLTPTQITGAVVLTFASLLLSFEKSRQHHGFHSGFIWAAVSGVFFAISHVAAKYLYGLYPFLTAFIWTRATTGLLAIALLFLPTVWKTLSARRNKTAQTYVRRHAKFMIILNKILSVVSVVLLQYAMAKGSVTLVGAMSGLQFVFMFVLIYLLTKLTPRIFKEYFTRRELAVETIAIVLVVIGTAVFAF